MPRKSSGLREPQRLRQQRYRQRLAIKAEPEVAELDTAAAIAIARMVHMIGEDRAVSVKTLIDGGLTAGVSNLIEKGYARSASIRLLQRRISSLKMALKNVPSKRINPNTPPITPYI
jgi:hypothetical protein